MDNVTNATSSQVVWDAEKGGWAVSKKAEPADVHKQLEKEIEKTKIVVDYFAWIRFRQEWIDYKKTAEKRVKIATEKITVYEKVLAQAYTQPKTDNADEKRKHRDAYDRRMGEFKQGVADYQDAKVKLEKSIQDADAHIQKAETTMAAMDYQQILVANARRRALEHVHACLTEPRSGQPQEEEKSSSPRANRVYIREDLHTGQTLEVETSKNVS